MSESIILSSPLLIALYGAALVLTLFGKLKRTGAVLPWVSAALVAGTSALSVLMGASLRETAAVIVLFILIHLIGPKEDRS